jgi:hypothetical protein
MKNKELINRGEKLYDEFIERAFNMPRMDIIVSTPRTNTLELFALLDMEFSDKMPLISAMCKELSDGMDSGVLAENGKLYRVVAKREYITN